MSNRLEGRICLITGASRGIGAAVAKAFAAEGAQTILVARTGGALEAVARTIVDSGYKSPILAPLDLTDSAQLELMAEGLRAKLPRLDVLLANAAMLGALSPLAQSDAEKFEQTIALNLTANYRLLRALDPLLRQSEAGRAIFVSSGVARTPMPYWGGYAVSKAALEHMAQIYAAETAKTNIKVHIVDPGVVRTAMRAEAYPGEDPFTLPPPEALVETFIETAMTSGVLPSGSRMRAVAAL